MSDDLVVMQQQVKTLAEIVSRYSLAAALGQSFDGKRNIYQQLGWPDDIKYLDYYGRYRRQGIAKRVIDLPVSASWRGKPEIQEKDTDDKETMFETAVKELIESSNLYNYCMRADKLAGIGQYSVIFLGFAGADQLTQPYTARTAGKLMYLSVYSQRYADIDLYDINTASNRYGLPFMYNIDFSRENLTMRSNPSLGKQQVHWTRVLHIVGDPLEDDIIGVPRLEDIFNNLMSAELISGGSGEMFWQGAFPGINFKADKEASFGVAERDEMKEQIEKFIHSMQRYLTLKGVEAQPLQGTATDPSNHLEAQIDQICAAKGIPKRIFMGSERGELASSQDQENWEDRLDERRKEYCEPFILRPLLDRFIEFGILPAPKNGYEVVWPDINALDAKEAVEIGAKQVESITKYAAAPGADTMVPLENILALLNVDQGTIDEIMAGLKKRQAEEEAEQMAQEKERIAQERTVGASGASESTQTI